MKKAVLWVVYKVMVSTKYGMPAGVNAVCEQDEWEALQRAHPAEQTLIREGITCESEAEKLARGTSGDPKYRFLSRW
jgi:hypothetical protein